MVLLVMGVAGSGKSTAGAALAERLDLPFYDADAFHPPANRAKMARNEPLDDHDRAPWLALVAEHARRWQKGGGAVLACSALKARYREILLGSLPHRIVFVDVDRGLAAARLGQRRGHGIVGEAFDRFLEGQFRDLEQPRDALVVSGAAPLAEIIDTIAASLAPRELRISDGGVHREISAAEADAHVAALLDGLDRQGDPLRRALLLPPDFTRSHSFAGEITAMLYEKLRARGAHVEVLPATGTHVAMTDAEIAQMLPRVPKEAFAVHDFRGAVTHLGDVPGSFVSHVSEGKLDYAIHCAIAAKVAGGRWDRVISVGQLVPHEVAGIANHAKNVFIGVGGKDTIDKSHFLGAVFGMERIMGRAQSPVREVLHFMSAELASKLPPITYVLTVRERIEGRTVTRGIFAGEDERCFYRGAKLARDVNVTFVDAPLEKVVVYLDPERFKSTWLGNKAIYRTRMALADAGELVVLAPGVVRFGEDDGIDRLIRKHGYRGTPSVLDGVDGDAELRASLSAAAHLIHGSSEGRFRITYATGGGLSHDTVVGVGYEHEDFESAARRYDPTMLRDGWNTVDGKDVFFVSHPAAGLWARRVTRSG
jgi:carbohydrate kinase (thermoresistant glucokinase family)